MIVHSKPTLTFQDTMSITNCLGTMMISRSVLGKKLEELLRSYLDTEYVKLTNSGTAALVLALRALNICKEIQEVLIPTYVCPSVESAILSCGATPVFYDNDVDWIGGLSSIQAKVSDRTSAIIIVHTLGISFPDIDGIKALNIPIIEDVCQAFGGEINGVKLGNFGEIGIYSFHATKCLTTGEGGALSTRNPDLAEAIDSEFKKISGLYAISDLNAALGISQLEQYPDFLRRRELIASRYFNSLPGWATASFKNFSDSNIFFRFLMDINGSFDEIKEKFASSGIAVRKGVDTLLHRNNNLDDEDFPIAVQIFNRTISLPLYPSLTDREIDIIIAKTNKILECYEG